mmetsp:Transcript_32007/g.37318  ORF Transcript_32007/g.37318 Transcript_32007/m.37318 type:complete len:152 (+) Transcript_32007:44-499(+)
MNQRKNFGRMMLLVCALFLGNMTFAQESMRADEIGNKWTSLTSIEGVNVSLKKEKVDVGAAKAFTYGMLRFENTTANDITLEFYFELQYENGCVGCGNVDEYRKVITIPAGTTLEGDATFEQPELSLLINNPYTIDLGEFQSLKAGQLTIK